jgi:hypothetical protein
MRSNSSALPIPRLPESSPCARIESSKEPLKPWKTHQSITMRSRQCRNTAFRSLMAIGISSYHRSRAIFRNIHRWNSFCDPTDSRACSKPAASGKSARYCMRSQSALSRSPSWSVRSLWIVSGWLSSAFMRASAEGSARTPAARAEASSGADDGMVRGSGIDGFSRMRGLSTAPSYHMSGIVTISANRSIFYP